MRSSLIFSILFAIISTLYIIAVCNLDIDWTIDKISGLGIIGLLSVMVAIGMFTIYLRERKRILKDRFCSTYMPDGTGAD